MMIGPVKLNWKFRQYYLGFGRINALVIPRFAWKFISDCELPSNLFVPFGFHISDDRDTAKDSTNPATRRLTATRRF